MPLQAVGVGQHLQRNGVGGWDRCSYKAFGGWVGQITIHKIQRRRSGFSPVNNSFFIVMGLSPFCKKDVSGCKYLKARLTLPMKEIYQLIKPKSSRGQASGVITVKFPLFFPLSLSALPSLWVCFLLACLPTQQISWSNSTHNNTVERISVLTTLYGKQGVPQKFPQSLLISIWSAGRIIYVSLEKDSLWSR